MSRIAEHRLSWTPRTMSSEGVACCGVWWGLATFASEQMCCRIGGQHEGQRSYGYELSFLSVIVSLS